MYMWSCLVVSCDDSAVFVQIYACAFGYLPLLSHERLLMVQIPVLGIHCDAGQCEINYGLNGQSDHLVMCSPQISACGIHVYESLASESRREKV